MGWEVSLVGISVRQTLLCSGEEHVPEVAGGDVLFEAKGRLCEGSFRDLGEAFQQCALLYAGGRLHGCTTCQLL